MKRLLVALDGSDHSWKALELAASFAKAEGAEVVLLHIVPYEPVPQALRDFARVEHMHMEDLEVSLSQGRELGDKIIGKAEARLREAGVGVADRVVTDGRPADSILATAEQFEVDMIFLGSRGLSDAKGLLLGSTSHRVANLAPCTCVAVK